MKKYVPVVGITALCMCINLHASATNINVNKNQPAPLPPANIAYMITPEKQQTADAIAYSIDFYIAAATSNSSNKLVAQGGAQNAGTSNIAAENPALQTNKWNPMYFVELDALSVECNKGLALKFQIFDNGTRNIDQSDSGSNLVSTDALNIITNSTVSCQRVKSQEKNEQWRLELDVINMGFQKGGAFMHTEMGFGYQNNQFQRNNTFFSTASDIYYQNYDARRQIWFATIGINLGVGPKVGNQGFIISASMQQHYGSSGGKRTLYTSRDNTGTLTYLQNEVRKESNFVTFQDYDLNLEYVLPFDPCCVKFSAGFFGQVQPSALDPNGTSNADGASVTTYGGKFGGAVTF